MNKDMMTFGGAVVDVSNKAPFNDEEENKGDTGANNGSNYQHEQAEEHFIGQNNNDLRLSDLQFNNKSQRDDQNYDLNIYKANSGSVSELKVNMESSMIGRSGSAH